MAHGLRVCSESKINLEALLISLQGWVLDLDEVEFEEGPRYTPVYCHPLLS